MTRTVPRHVDTGEIIEHDEIEIEGEILPETLAQTDQVSILSKITISEIGGNPAMAKATQTQVPVALIMGRCIDTKSVEDPNTHKVFTALVGAFSAINLQNGQEFKSGVLYLPDAFQNYVIAALERSREAPQRRGLSAFRGVEFSYKVDVKPAGNPAGYSYVLQNLLAAVATDPTAHLRTSALKVLGLDPRGPLQLEFGGKAVAKINLGGASESY